MNTKMKREINKLHWENFIALLIVGCINAFGVTVFLAPKVLLFLSRIVLYVDILLAYKIPLFINPFSLV